MYGIWWLIQIVSKSKYRLKIQTIKTKESTEMHGNEISFSITDSFKTTVSLLYLPFYICHF